jgi:hypothetical protein
MAVTEYTMAIAFNLFFILYTNAFKGIKVILVIEENFKSTVGASETKALIPVADDPMSHSVN